MTPTGAYPTCPTCGEITGGSHYHCAKCNGSSGMQGHYTRFCRVAKRMVRDHHFCCPDNCHLAANAEPVAGGA